MSKSNDNPRTRHRQDDLTTDKITNVSLNLEETGTLCHLLLPHILALKKPVNEADSIFARNDINRAMVDRMDVLYAKLADANDLLMEKRP